MFMGTGRPPFEYLVSIYTQTRKHLVLMLKFNGRPLVDLLTLLGPLPWKHTESESTNML